jgi:hypothetical protein
MQATRSTFWGRTAICALALMAGAGTQHPALAQNAPSADDAYLEALRGDWDMSGTLLGKPVKYRARGERVRHLRV